MGTSLNVPGSLWAPVCPYNNILFSYEVTGCDLWSSDNMHLPLSLPTSEALEPNYPPRTKRSNHKARSRSSVHQVYCTGLQYSRHTCRCFGCGVDKTVANQPFIWRPVLIQTLFGFQNHSLKKGHVAHISFTEV